MNFWTISIFQVPVQTLLGRQVNICYSPSYVTESQFISIENNKNLNHKKKPWRTILKENAGLGIWFTSIAPCLVSMQS